MIAHLIADNGRHMAFCAVYELFRRVYLAAYRRFFGVGGYIRYFK